MPKSLCMYLALLTSLPAVAAQRQIALDPLAKTVKRLDKIDFTIRTDATFANPYDPAEADLRVEFTSPSGKLVTVPAFFFQPFERKQVERGGRKGEWLYPTGPAGWRVRFAPTEDGAWSARAMLKSRENEVRSEPARFECTPSDNKGFIRVSTKDPRYLEFQDGSPFFAIGQNVAFVTDSYHTIDMLRKLGENKANFARIWACSEDWAMGIEARKSAWGRSWDWRPPFVQVSDREGYHQNRMCIRMSGDANAGITMNPCQAVALRASTKYRFTGRIRGDDSTSLMFNLGGEKKVAATRQWSKFSEEFTTGQSQLWLGQLSLRLSAKGSIFLSDLSLRESAGGAELLTEADPNRPPIGVYNQADCAMLDALVEAAEQFGVRLQLVLLTRDHYMHMLTREGLPYDTAVMYAKALARYASARWGYSTHVMAWEYFNEMDPGLPTGRFYSEVGEALELFDVNHHIRATSGWRSPTKEFRHPRLETADMHHYLRQATGEIWKDEVASVLAQWKAMQPALSPRPLMFAEFGITDNNWQKSPLLERDADWVHLHNALWASAMSGFASTVCHWYWDDVHRRDGYRHYRALAEFCADIQFTTAQFKPAAASCTTGLRVLGLQGERCAYLWINDPSATWWKIAIDGTHPAEIRSAKLRLEGLKPGDYAVRWFDTKAGKVVREETLSAKDAPVELSVPVFTADIAVKIISPK